MDGRHITLVFCCSGCGGGTFVEFDVLLADVTVEINLI